MERLEQILYQPRQIFETPKTEQLYRTSDLEEWSVVVLYTGPIGKYKDFTNSWGKSFNTDLYIKNTPLGQLHVHCTKEGLVTGANLNGKPISNYEASMIDLLSGKSLYKKGFGKW